MEEILLKRVCSIRTGVSVIKEGSSIDSAYSLIRLKDISDDGILNTNLKKVSIKKLLYDHIIKKDEVIFKAKSINNVAAIIKEDGKFITTSHFLILSVKDEKILMPDYLCLYLNEKNAQRYFKKIGAGTSSPIITKQDLERLKIIVPSLEKQQRVVEIYNLWFKEKELLKEKIEIKDKYIKEMIEMLMTGILK
ncbi:hypothetical protein FDA77_07065 [Clostridium botulinum]|uniref:restriction endonuclease subunit S n=1 Tax=Clostridium botulinum TaxID=1491 RepID=UPI0013F6DE9E|nr:restriction endonuclease subunit S [Clostridium botulinum]MBY6886482.1 restriction endonuclease subunit S [Clostridium botulinum]NFD96767.1 hypothetical protein [Clostridium botulinum]NFI45031.1 hypothetical protein [Clostridium botulinum]NFJ82917.1 hypothetical protein [Clostridium botulinum]NFJ89668.1 hypothetical protein [Clostridium botulinum]